MTTKRRRITFKRGASYYGRIRLAPSYRVRCDGHEIAIIQCCDSFVQEGSLWFWYGDGENTASNPQPLDICKEDVRGHFLRSLGEIE